MAGTILETRSWQTFVSFNLAVFPVVPSGTITIKFFARVDAVPVFGAIRFFTVVDSFLAVGATESVWTQT